MVLFLHYHSSRNTHTHTQTHTHTHKPVERVLQQYAKTGDCTEDINAMWSTSAAGEVLLLDLHDDCRAEATM